MEDRRPSDGGLGALAPGLLFLSLIADAFLVGAHLLFPRTLLLDFNLDVEANVPTWYASAQLALLATLLAANGLAARARRGLAWLGAALLFAALSLDEVQQIHENAGFHLSLSPWAEPLSDRLAAALPGAGQLRGMLWIVLLAPVALAALGWLAWFVRSRLGGAGPRATLALSGLGLFGAALLCELLSLWDFGARGYRYQVALEEGAELAGVSLLAAAAAAALEARLRRRRPASCRLLTVAGLRLRRALPPFAAAAAAALAAGWAWGGMPLWDGFAPDGWTARGSPHIPLSRESFAFDRDPYSAWTTAGPMRGVEWFELDLGEVREVREVCLYVGGLRRDHPRRFSIETSAAGTGWAPWGDPQEGAGALSAMTCSARPDRRPVRRVRIRQLGEDRIFHWSIAEIFVR